MSLTFLRQLFRRDAEPEHLSVRDFTESYVQAVRAAYPEVIVDVVHGPTPDRTRVHWVGEDGFEVNQFMAEWYRRYRQAPDQRNALHAEQLGCARQAGGAAPEFGRPEPCKPGHSRPPRDARDESLASILPMIKTQAWRADLHAQCDAAGVPPQERPLCLPLAGSLVLGFRGEPGPARRDLSIDHVQRLGLDVRSVQTWALKNLVPRLADLQAEPLDDSLTSATDRPAGDPPGQAAPAVAGRRALFTHPPSVLPPASAYAVHIEGMCGASLVLLFALWRDKLSLEGEPLIMLPARDCFLIAGARDEDGVRRMQAHGARMMEASLCPLSDELFVWRDGRLQVHPAFRAVGY